MIYKKSALRAQVCAAAFVIGSLVPAADAALTMNIVNNTVTGITTFYFEGSGSVTLGTPNVWEAPYSTLYSSDSTKAIGGVSSMGIVFEDYETGLAVTGYPAFNDFSRGGYTMSDSGGFYIYIDPVTGDSGEVLIYGNQVSGDVLTWAGELSVEETLVFFGLEAGTSGVITGVKNGTEVFSINWTVTQIPEPTTYAACFGLVALGVALRHYRKSK